MAEGELKEWRGGGDQLIIGVREGGVLQEFPFRHIPLRSSGSAVDSYDGELLPSPLREVRGGSLGRGWEGRRGAGGVGEGGAGEGKGLWCYWRDMKGEGKCKECLVIVCGLLRWLLYYDRLFFHFFWKYSHHCLYYPLVSLVMLLHVFMHINEQSPCCLNHAKEIVPKDSQQRDHEQKSSQLQFPPCMMKRTKRYSVKKNKIGWIATGHTRRLRYKEIGGKKMLIKGRGKREAYRGR